MKRITPKRKASRVKIGLGRLRILFFAAGLIALACYGYVQMEAHVYQSYQSWSLDQRLQHKPATYCGFLASWLPAAFRKPLSEPSRETIGPPVASSFPQAAPPAPRPPTPVAAMGSLIGRIEIPRLELSAVVMEGVDAHTLRLAAGHLPGSPLPGAAGNVSIAAHRDTFFRGLRDIQRDDVVTLSTADGGIYRYRVDSVSVVTPSDTEILNANPGPGLNLITCFPFNYVGAAPKRFVVHAGEIGGVNPVRMVATESPQVVSRAFGEVADAPRVQQATVIRHGDGVGIAHPHARRVRRVARLDHPARSSRASSHSRTRKPAHLAENPTSDRTQTANSRPSSSRHNWLHAIFSKL